MPEGAARFPPECRNGKGVSAEGKAALPERSEPAARRLFRVCAKGGSAGGHNGLKNIDSQIGQNYNRIRIGVGSPQEHHTDTVNFVLSRFSKTEMEILQERLDFIAKTINELINKGITHYSNLVGMHNSK